MASLYLHAADPHWVPREPAELTDSLAAIDLIGMPFAEAAAEAFCPGEQFLALVIFLGCSPNIELDPHTARDGAAVCHVQLHCFDQPRFVSAAGAPKPRCPACRASLAEAPRAMPADAWRCAACGAEMPVYALDWRRGAGFARCFIEVHGVFPHEAVPADKLLATLAGLSACPWNYFYR